MMKAPKMDENLHISINQPPSLCVEKESIQAPLEFMEFMDASTQDICLLSLECIAYSQGIFIPFLWSKFVFPVSQVPVKLSCTPLLATLVQIVPPL